MSTSNHYHYLIFSLFFAVCMSLQAKAWGAEEIDYRFERMLPHLEQPWYFNSPYSVAVAADGSVWMADAGNNRIQHFTSDGSLLAGFGLFGQGAGEFFQPSGIAVAADGSVWVADTFNHRLQHFKQDGSFIAQFGSFGTGPGQFASPNGVTVANDGSVWIADSDNHRVQHVSGDGRFIAQFGGMGAGNGQFKQPRGIALASDGSVWVADTDNHRLQHFQADGKFIASVGKQGNGTDGFSFPYGVVSAADGSLWVADTSNNRIQHLNAQGGFIAQVGSWGNAAGQLWDVRGVALAPDGTIWAADAYNHRLQHFKADGGFIALFGSAGANAGQFKWPGDVAIAADQSVWVADSDNHRIQHFSADGRFIGQFGANGSGVGQLSSPHGLTVAVDGSVWVADTFNNRIQHFAADGRVLGQFGLPGSNDGQLKYPADIAIVNGNLWVADFGNHRLQRFKADGSFLSKYALGGTVDTSVIATDIITMRIAAGSDGSLWVADCLNDSVLQLDAAGNLLKQLGMAGSEPGQFLRPSGITVAADGSVWVADTWNNRLQQFKADGSFVAQFGSVGSGTDQFSSPNGVAVANDSSLWVVDTGNHRLQKFTPSAKTTIAHPYKAIILAGGGQVINQRTNNLWSGTWRVATKAYRALSLQGFKAHQEIAFLTADNTQIDLDNNRLADDLEPANKANLQRRITEWATDAKEVLIYLVDHGGPGRFQLNGSEILTGEELAGWVEQLEQKIPGKVTLIFDSCNSAGFFGSLAKPTRPRYLLASTKAEQFAVLSNDGLNSFSYTFWSEIMSGIKLQDAFKTARQAMSATRIDNAALEAQLDADADNNYTAADLATLGNYCLGQCITTAAGAPAIKPISPSTLTLAGNARQNFSINVQHLQNLLQVWALVQRPDDLAINPDQPLNFTKIPLSCAAPVNAQTQCTGSYDRFDVQGTYQLSFYAMDTNFEVSLPEILSLQQTKGDSISPVDYDYQQTTLALRDVIVAGQHFQALMYYQDGQFVLLPNSVKAISQFYNPPAEFDANSQILKIPLAKAFGQNYQATLKQQGDLHFSLQTAAPK